MKRFFIVLVSCALIVVALLFSADAYSFRGWLELSHPNVRWIAPSALARRLERGEVTLIDVRGAEEYDQSHLLGALRAGAQPPAGREVVVYCSLGVRSAEYAERLQDDGFDVLNLDGGIFAWANEGRPIVDAQESMTKEVHPYSSFFGLFLEAPE